MISNAASPAFSTPGLLLQALADIGAKAFRIGADVLERIRRAGFRGDGRDAEGIVDAGHFTVPPLAAPVGCAGPLSHGCHFAATLLAPLKKPPAADSSAPIGACSAWSVLSPACAV